MSKKKIFFGLIIIICGTFVFLYGANFFRQKKNNLKINDKQFSVEVVSDQVSRQKGLSGRAELCVDCGMLFIFAEPAKYTFWMKDMQFPLDIIWISEHRVVYVAEKVPANSRDTIQPPVDADRVLEINAGLCAQYGIGVGDEVYYNE